ncbi:hypothetical protein EVAR_68953_1 [Eumeta japonica]|uniref:Uncharacterized protein n=1 Tax=Eumeta variegata TaxID=151549 RepID=A0A4C2A011_EUMVA|nr:hypothetical protein EVAR_68953_1 [Eumeta japonica]
MPESQPVRSRQDIQICLTQYYIGDAYRDSSKTFPKLLANVVRQSAPRECGRFPNKSQRAIDRGHFSCALATPAATYQHAI